jgi:hypothetical protein
MYFHKYISMIPTAMPYFPSFPIRLIHFTLCALQHHSLSKGRPLEILFLLCGRDPQKIQWLRAFCGTADPANRYIRDAVKIPESPSTNINAFEAGVGMGAGGRAVDGIGLWRHVGDH